MTNPRMLLLGITFILFAIGMVLVLDTQKAEPTVQACTKELKICPDGSGVGRTGPNCSFAECRTVSEDPQSKSGSIGEVIQGGSVLITPVQVVSDSRCPVDVTCIWAGTVTLEAKIDQAGTSTVVELMLNEPYIHGGSLITLISVTPEAESIREIEQHEYRFEFLIDSI